MPALLRLVQWKFWSHFNSHYPVPETKVALRDIPKIKRLPVSDMSKQDQDYMRQWASGHGKAVRQLSVRQNNTKHAAGTLPLNMYRKELPVGDWVTEDPSSADDIGDQLSENDSDSSRRRRQCHPRRRHSRECSCKLAIKDSPHAYRTTDHAFISCSFFILRYKKLFLFAEAFKNTRKFKISIERINPHLTFISFCRN